MTVGSMSSSPYAGLQRPPDQKEAVRHGLHPLHGFRLAQHVSHTVALDKYRKSFCALLQRRLPHLSLKYAKAQAPTLASLDGLAHLVPENARVPVLSVNTAGTILESAQGGRIVLDYEDFPSVAQLENFFTMEALPSNLVRATRVDYDRKWRSWVTFAAAHGRLEAVFPADLALLRAFVTHMVLCQYTPGTIAQFLACIVTRHEQFGARDIFAWGEFSKWLGGVRTTLGACGKDKFRTCGSTTYSPSPGFALRPFRRPAIRPCASSASLAHGGNRSLLRSTYATGVKIWNLTMRDARLVLLFM